MTETNDWITKPPPKNGSEINVQFPDGTKAKAKWNAQASQWEVPYEGKWRNMRYAHGAHDPCVWWL